MSDVPVPLTRKVIVEKRYLKVQVFKEDGDTEDIKIKITDGNKNKIIVCDWRNSTYRVWRNKWGTTTVYGEVSDDDWLFFHWDD